MSYPLTPTRVGRPTRRDPGEMLGSDGSDAPVDPVAEPDGSRAKPDTQVARVDARRIGAHRHHGAGEPIVERADEGRGLTVRIGAVTSEHVEDGAPSGARRQPRRSDQR